MKWVKNSHRNCIQKEVSWESVNFRSIKLSARHRWSWIC